MTPLGEMLMRDGFEMGLERGTEKGAKGIISTFQELGLTYEEALQKITEKLEISQEDAAKYMAQFWKIQ